MKELLLGERIKLVDFVNQSALNKKLFIEVVGEEELDITCFGLDSEEKLSDDRYMIFFNQLISPNNEILANLSNPKKSIFEIELNKLPAKIKKLVFTLTLDSNKEIRNIKPIKLNIGNGIETSIQFVVKGEDFRSEKAIILAEVYFKDLWRLNAVAKGFDGGLSTLLKHFGGQEIKKEKTVKDIINLKKFSGKISLLKGEKPVLIEKTPLITATVSWETGTDYDIYALVLTNENKQIDVATFGAKGVPSLTNYNNGTIVHLGDVVSTHIGQKEEKIEIRFTKDIVAVVPVVYSAQSNGTGSFYKYKVSILINNHNGTNVKIDAINANKDNKVYTCVPAIIRNTEQGIIIEPVELYSKPNSEKRPKLIKIKEDYIEVLMDQGPMNDYK